MHGINIMSFNIFARTHIQTLTRPYLHHLLRNVFKNSLHIFSFNFSLLSISLPLSLSLSLFLSISAFHYAFRSAEQSLLYDNNMYHEECLRCNACAINLTGVNQKRARRFKNQILCDLHFAGLCRIRQYFISLTFDISNSIFLNHNSLLPFSQM